MKAQNINLTCIYPGPVNTNIIKNSKVWDKEKQTIEKEFLEKQSLPVQLVANRILNAVEKKKVRVLTGKETYLCDFMARFFPVTTNYLIGKIRKHIPFI